MVVLISESNILGEFERSLFNHLRTTQEGKYILFRSNLNFRDLLKNEQLFTARFQSFFVNISAEFKLNKKDLDEFQTYLQILKNSNKIFDVDSNNCNYLIIEKDKGQIVNDNYENVKGNDEVVDSIFIQSIPKFSLDQVVLNQVVKEEIMSAMVLINNSNLIYKQWGFEEIDSKPRLILNFYGHPGTGKTMTAHAIAHVLKKNILLINYSDVESKYVGDAPKNLVKAFKEAKASNSVMFFDEADSFLGKRIESVTSSSDQAINSLRSQMLILLEDFEGVVIFATNLVRNFDKAFESRILKNIEFQLPDKEQRILLLEKMFVKKLPLHKDLSKEELCLELSILSDGFSGREIKNAMLESLTKGAHMGLSVLDESCFIQGFLSYKEKKETLEKSKGGISSEFKNKIEEKIKQNLSKTAEA